MNSIDKIIPGLSNNSNQGDEVQEILDSVVRAYNSSVNASSGLGGCNAINQSKKP